MARTLPALLVLASSAFAQIPEYLPLQLGNQWVYRASLGEPLEVSVSRLESAGGHTYSVLSGMGSETWLRYASDGLLMQYDREARTESVYLNFTVSEGASYRTTAHPCNTTAELQSKSFKDSFPLGEFSNVAQVRYGGNVCADAGLTADYYLPYIGLLRRTETSFTGPRTYDLIYARINGTVMVSTNETSFSLSTDKPIYVNSGTDVPIASARITLRTSEDLILEFGTGQEIDCILSDSDGNTIFKWSDGQSFTQAMKTVRVSKERNWATRIPLKSADGQTLRGGIYTLEGRITTLGGPRYRAIVTIEIAEIRPAN